MKLRQFLIVVAVALFCSMFSSLAFANTPGKHSVTLTWNDSGTGIASYNIYRGISAGVCNGTPTPYANTGSNVLIYIDTLNLTDGAILFYNVSAVGTGGAESACNGEVTVTIPTFPQAASGLAATAK